MKENNFKELARDLISFGSPIFFVIVLARVSILSNWEYLSQFLFAGILFYGLAFLLKTDKRAGMGAVLLIFTVIYYNSPIFSWFAGILFVFFIGAMYYLRIEKLEIVKSIFSGLVSAGISYYLVNAIFNS